MRRKRVETPADILGPRFFDERSGKADYPLFVSLPYYILLCFITPAAKRQAAVRIRTICQ
ncbi:MAG: hypothetical protein IJ533_02010 [Prevotella sp.]|nr:hypothetical protein [Prevotella sp.]MBR1558017.1 hypothetical protein [Prevotella sp.]